MMIRALPLTLSSSWERFWRPAAAFPGEQWELKLRENADLQTKVA